MEYSKIKQVNKGNKILMKYNNKIIGFIQEMKDKTWGYVFGKPSQSNYIMFYTNTKEESINHFLEACEGVYI